MDNLLIASEPALSYKEILNEDFLHYIWKTQNFDQQDLRTTDGDLIDVLHRGTHNFSHGPDFSEVKFKMNEITWAGHGEIHIRSSDWLRHQHEKDKNYDNVVLHIVFIDDAPVYNSSGIKIPTIELNSRIKKEYIFQAQELLNNQNKLACSHFLPKISRFWLNQWIERQLVEGIEDKTKFIFEQLEKSHNNWEFVCFKLLAKSMAFHSNSEQFQSLFNLIPWPLIQKLKHDINLLESLFFGVGNLIPEKLQDDYIDELKVNYGFIQLKYRRFKKTIINWKFRSVRPNNYPTIRLAQLAAIVVSKPTLFRQIVEAKNVKELKSIFEQQPNAYWKTHFIPGIKTSEHGIIIGQNSVKRLLINFCVPLQYAYGMYQNDEALKERAIKFLYELPAENNRITRLWNAAQIKSMTAADSHALIYTHKNYCSKKKCLTCQVGHKVMNKKD